MKRKLGATGDSSDADNVGRKVGRSEESSNSFSESESSRKLHVFALMACVVVLL